MKSLEGLRPRYPIGFKDHSVDRTRRKTALVVACVLFFAASSLGAVSSFADSLPISTLLPMYGIVSVADDLFVFNLIGSLNNNTAWTPNGVTPDQVLSNLTATSGNCFQALGGNSVQFGTFLIFLATNECSFQFSDLFLSRTLWNTDGHIQVPSGSRISGNDPFEPRQTVEAPEPASLLMLGIAFVAIGLVRKKIAVYK